MSIRFSRDGFIPFGAIHQIQITDKELYAFEPLLLDAICFYEHKIADLRKKLGIPSEYPNQLGMLSEIQEIEGKKKAILKDIIDQLELD